MIALHFLLDLNFELWQTFHIAEGMHGRKNVQIFASFAANLGQMAVGHCVPLSSFLLPQMIPGGGDLVLSEEEGSWFGENFYRHCF